MSRKLTLFDDGGVDITGNKTGVTVQRVGADASTEAGVLFEFSHGEVVLSLVNTVFVPNSFGE